MPDVHCKVSEVERGTDGSDDEGHYPCALSTITVTAAHPRCCGCQRIDDRETHLLTRQSLMSASMPRSLNRRHVSFALWT